MLLTHGAIQKGIPTEFTLSKTDLFAIVSTLDAYFGVASNVKDLLVVYQSTQGNQKEILRFDLSQEEPTATFLVSERARDEFLLKTLILNDFDNDSLTIQRSQLSSTVLAENGALSVLSPTLSFAFLPTVLTSLSDVSNPITAIILTTSNGLPPTTDAFGNNLNLIYAQSYVEFQNGVRAYAFNANGSASGDTQMSVISSALYSSANPLFNYSVSFLHAGDVHSLWILPNEIQMAAASSLPIGAIEIYSPNNQPYSFATVVS